MLSSLFVLILLAQNSFLLGVMVDTKVGKFTGSGIDVSDTSFFSEEMCELRCQCLSYSVLLVLVFIFQLHEMLRLVGSPKLIQQICDRLENSSQWYSSLAAR